MSVHYTLANADEKVLMRHDPNVYDRDLTLMDVYKRFERGQTLEEISKDIPELPRTKLLFARAFFASANPQAYQASAVTPLKVVCDENIDPHISTDMARQTFGEATHVSFLGLADSRDVDIWKYAVRNRVNLILSRDKALVKTRPTWDLTRCSHEFWQWRLNAGNNAIGSYIRKLPRILHVEGSATSSEEIGRRLHEHHRQITEIFEEAISPTISLYAHQAKPGKHFLEFIEEGRFERMRQTRDEIVAMVHGVVGGEKISPMLKRIVEFEMYNKTLSPVYMKMSDELKKEIVFRSIVDEVTLDDQNVQRQVIDDYKTRGLVSIFNPKAEVIHLSQSKPITSVDPLTISIQNRLQRYRRSGQLLISRRAKKATIPFGTAAYA